MRLFLIKTMDNNKPYNSFQQFWPFYLSQHQNFFSRLLHYFGTISSHLLLIIFVLEKYWLGLIFIPLIGYGPAWIGHFLIEFNKPATFKYPLWSLMADYKMLYLAVFGRLKVEIARFSNQFTEQ